MTLTGLRRRLTRRQPALYARIRDVRGRMTAHRKGLGRQGTGSYVSASALVHRDSRLGAYAYVGPECHLSAPVSVGRYSMLAPRVAIVGADHVYTEPGVPAIFAGRPAMPATVIGSDVWLGYGVIVLAGVTIGDATIVGAGSVVTSDLPPSMICVGNPARPIRARFPGESDAALHQKHLDGETQRGRFACAQ